MPLRPLALLVALALLPQSVAAAQDQDYARAPLVLVDHGIICDVRPEGSRAAPDTLMGEINLIDTSRDIDVTTRIVPAVQGISFGMKFALQAGAGSRDVSVVVIHPPMGPEGITRESWIAPLYEGQTSLNLFTFEFPYEMVAGTWIMAIEHDGTRLMEQRFEVVPELAAPAVLSACFGQDFLS